MRNMTTKKAQQPFRRLQGRAAPRGRNIQSAMLQITKWKLQIPTQMASGSE